MTTKRTTRPTTTDRPPAWESGLLVIDKPAGMTSHDVVARVRRLAHTRKVGHAGTLDPMATGVLVIGIEKATRLLGHLMLTEKTYHATIRLGQSTTTDDAEGEPTGGRSAAGLDPGVLATEIAKLTGDILQVPSSVSAIKVNGQRAYKLTRAGEAPELAARPVTVYQFEVTATRRDGDFTDLDAVVRCSSGTYIRALARDLGAALGAGGHLTALRRSAVGPYTLATARTLAELENQDQQKERTSAQPVPPAQAAPASDIARPAEPPPAAKSAPPAPGAPATQVPSPTEAAAPATPPAAVTPPAEAAGLIPLAAAAAAAFPRLDLTADDARRLVQGARLPLPADPPAPDIALAAFAPDGTLVALVTADAGRLKSLAVFAA
jgi:tRNA pseudouridine55 synthase